MAKVLILEQSKSMRNTLRERLEFEGFATAVALREEVSESLCARRGYDAIVAGGATEDVAALGVPFIIISSSGTIEGAVDAVRSGAEDYITTPVDMNRLLGSLRRIVERSDEGECVEAVKPSRRRHCSDAEQIIGSSEEIKQVRKLIDKVAASDARVLITGENGTGKDVLANEIHRLSARANRPMVCVDAGAITETLFESELFGHVKGAFTDAHADHVGKFEQANGGTLFLDEIGNIPLHLQAKLLRVLQNRAIVRVGDTKEIPIDIRLICATNRDIPQMVQDGTFREDLYYRINTMHLQLPPLRQRQDEILPLAERFMQTYAERYHRNVNALAPEAQQALLAHTWSGNIRELNNCIEKAVILSEGDTLTLADLQLPLPSNTPYPIGGTPSNSQYPTADSEAVETLEAVEERAIRNAMAQHDGNLSLVAKALNISRPTLYAKLKKYGI